MAQLSMNTKKKNITQEIDTNVTNLLITKLLDQLNLESLKLRTIPFLVERKEKKRQHVKQKKP